MKSEILLHLLYASLSLSVFYLIFWLFLRKSTHFTLNRAYLVLSMVLSITLPLVNVPQLGFYRNVNKVTLIPNETISRNSFKVVPQVDLHVNGETKKETTPDITSAIGFTSLLFWSYSTGLALMLSRLLMMVSSLWSLYRSARFKTLPDGTRLAITHKIKAPSSFFNLLFIPESGISDHDIDGIIAHEQVHIWQYHSLDILLAELTVAFLWFNPFSWLFKRAIRNVHEYLADEGVVHQGIHPRQYQMLLLKYAVDKKQLSLSNTLNRLGLKHRIAMMNKKRSNSLARWKVLVIFPIATCLLMAWAYPIPYGHGHERQEGTRSIRGKVIHQDSDSDQPIPGTDIMVKGTDINTVTGEDGSYWLENVPGQAREILFFSREHGFLLVQITPTDTLVDVALSRSQLSMFRKSPDSPWRGLYPYPTVRALNINPLEPQEPIYIIDGQILKGDNALQGINPEEIVSIRVLRDTVAAVFYGQAAKNGVVLITTKQFQNKNNKLYDKRDSLYQRMSRFKQDSIIRTYPGHPVYIQNTQRRLLVYVIDGEVHKGEPFYMYPDEIESMEVIRNPEAAKAYGVSAGGVIRIKTRNSDDNSGNKN